LKLLMAAGAIFDRMLGVLMFAACAIFTFTMLLVCADVIMRYVLNRPIVWAMEVCEYILVGIVSLGLAWLLKEEGHVKIDFLLIQLNTRLQGLVNAITSALGAAAVVIITWYGLDKTFEFIQAGFAQETGTLGIHKAYLLTPLAIGCFLLFIQLVRRSYKNFRGWKIDEGQ